MANTKGRAKTAGKEDRAAAIAKQHKAILDLIASGESVRKACKAVGVDEGTFRSRTLVDAELFTQYTRARDMGYDVMADETVDIADELPPMTDKGNYDSGAVQHQKNRIDARRWLISKRKPKVYGDSVKLTGDADNPLQIQTVKRVIVDK